MTDPQPPPLALGSDARVVVVGASLAGTNAAATLRREGFAGEVVVIDSDPDAPYDRPPLTKQVLAGTWDPDRIGLPVRPGTPDGDALTWRTATTVTGLRLRERELLFATGDVLPFDGLVIASGSRARWLPGTKGIAGVHVVRTLANCLALQAEIRAGASRVAVVGAGFIGGEVAATCRVSGMEVAMIEALDVPLERVLGARVGAVFADLHRSHGVEVHLGVGVAGLDVRSGRVRAVRLADGTEVPADAVVVGVGAGPAVEWLEGSGLDVTAGVLCDERLAVLGADGAPLEGIVAAGDVASWVNPLFGARMRVEHWDTAIAAGSAAALTLLGRGVPFAPVPWFWTDQYDRKLQLAGWTGAGDEMEVIDGSLDEQRFVALYGREGRLVGVVGMNRPAPVMQWRSRIADRLTWAEALAVAEVES